MGERTYLDWNAGAPLLPEVREAVAAVLAGELGNPSSVHAEGRRARDLVEQARHEVAALAGARPAEVVFTAGGAEANASALAGLLAGDGGPSGKALALAGVEHPSLLASAEQLERRGAALHWLPVTRDGALDLDALAELLRGGRVDLVAVQLANSETGVVQRVAEVAALARRHGVLAHCDAVQAAGKMAVNVESLGIDTLSLSSHKLGGLAGSGALVVRTARLGEPLVPGTQEQHRRGGTENLLGIVAFGAAARVARDRLDAWRTVAATRDALEERVLAAIGGIVIYGRGASRLPNTSCIGFPAPLVGGALVAALDLAGFAVSSGSACSSGVERGSRVVETMGFGSDAARRTVRVSAGPETGGEVADRLAGALAEIVRRGRGGRP